MDCLSSGGGVTGTLLSTVSSTLLFTMRSTTTDWEMFPAMLYPSADAMLRDVLVLIDKRLSFKYWCYVKGDSILSSGKDNVNVKAPITIAPLPLRLSQK